MQFKYFSSLLLALCVTIGISSAQNVPDFSVTQPGGTINAIQQPPPLSIYQEPSYLRTFVPKVPITDATVIQTGSSPVEVQVATAFKDGFNRTVQSVQHNFTVSSKPHLVQLADTRFQQQENGFLPYPATNEAYDPYIFTNQYNYSLSAYPGELYTGYSIGKNISDASKRATKTLSPGRSQVGQNRGVTVQQTTNAAGEVKLWELDANGLPVSNGTYPAGMLFGQQVYDTMGALVTTYTDRDGRVVCKIVKQESQVVQQGVLLIYGTTQYIYDAMGRLAYTLPPRASAVATGSTVSQGVRDSLCFQYRYDTKGRLSAQRFPGEQAFTEVVYDLKQRPVMRRSPNEAATNKWEITYYDVQGRVKATSLWTNSNTRDYWQNIMDAGTGSNSPADLTYYLLNPTGEPVYPAENAISGNTMMSYTYYDDYTRADPTGSKWNTCTSTLFFTQAEMMLNVPGSETPLRSNRTHGMLTGSRIRILPSPNADLTKTGDWREGVVWYDDKGRVINTMSRDLYQTNTVVHATYTGSQYDFTGKVLVSKQVVFNANSTDATNSRKELTRNEYEPATGRLLKVLHKVGDNGSWQTLAMYQYDEMGQVKRNILGNYGEVRDMQYNIRGQLTGINAVYAETGNKEGESRSFGESLKYDYGFTQARYDGKIAGMIWRGSNITNGYAYGYSYDYGGRLVQADFRKQIAITGGGSAWSNITMDYTVSNLKYDLNGNIASMKQRGMGLVNGSTVPVTMDDLSYTYYGNSNQLLKVQDPQPNYSLGDFVNTNGASNDYTYDPNGNLITDANKGINSVSYTHFNKPQVTIFANDKRIEYSYDASGNKVQELLIDPGFPTKRTDYVGNNVYENDKVQYLLTGTGRTTFDPANGVPKEEFFVKDHLGNVRSVVDVYTYLIQQYLATYELASANLENLFFDDVDEVRDDRPGSTWNGDLKSARLNGADPERRVGTSMLMHVMAGDKVEMNVNNYYEGYDGQQDSPLPAEEMLSSIINTLVQGPGGSLPGEGHDVEQVNNAFNWPNFEKFQQLTEGSTDPSKPRAYLNYILFDEQMRMVNTASGAFQANGNGSWTQIGTTAPMEIPSNGYLAVYLSNSSQMGCLTCSDVFFDQLVIRFTRGKLKEENHYYPFGLPMAGMGSAAAGFKENRRKYQSNEYIKDFGLNWMDFQARQYDPQLGRFLGVDPLADGGGQSKFSPYAAMGNMPESHIDPNGTIFTEAAQKMVDQFIVDVRAKQAANNARILSLNNMLGGELEDIFGINQEISDLQNNNMDLEVILTEVGELDVSSQVYDMVFENESLDMRDPTAAEKGSESGFDFGTGVFEMVVRDRNPGSIAHELTHAFQFEKSRIDFGAPGSRSFIGDRHDEMEAWNRTMLFATKTYRNPFNTDNLPSKKYQNMPKGPLDVTNGAPYSGVIKSNTSPETLQKLANYYHIAFRINGQTYYPN
jgi:RHS repeat-associated protein